MKSKSIEHRLAHRYAVLNRATQRRYLKDAKRHQKGAASYAETARICRANDLDNGAQWQEIAAQSAKWARHYLLAALHLETDERELINEARSRLCNFIDA